MYQQPAIPPLPMNIFPSQYSTVSMPHHTPQPFQQMMFAPYVTSLGCPSSSTEMEVKNSAGVGLFEDDFVALQQLLSPCCANCGQSIIEGYRHYCEICNIDFCTGCTQAVTLVYGYPHEHLLTSISL
jgi:hypothetical protein